VFFGLSEATKGGQTPINSGAELFARLEVEAPDFIEELATKVRSFALALSRLVLQS